MSKADLERLLEQGALFRVIVDSVRDYAILSMDLAGRITSWNAGAELIKGYRAEEVLGRLLDIFYTPEDRERGLPQAMLRAAAVRGSVATEGWRVRKDGRRFWGSVLVTALRDERGRLVGFAKITRDLTERRRAEEELRAAERRAMELAREQAAREAAEELTSRMRLLVRASEVLSSSLDLDATLDNAARQATPDIADWCAVDLVGPGRTLRRVAVAHPDPEKREIASRCLERFPAEAEPHPLWGVIDSGEALHLPELSDEILLQIAGDPEYLDTLRGLGLGAVLSVPLVGRTGVLGALTLVREEPGRGFSEADRWLAGELGRHAALSIENARLHGELEARKAEAEAANRAKSAFLAATSHELRTPLNAIVGYSELLELGVQGPVNQAQREALGRIKTNQRALLALINDVLNFAKLESGSLELATEDVRVDELMVEMRAMVAPQMEAKGLRYTQSVHGADLLVRGDKDRVEQILLNLLTNAIKFTESGGEVQLTAEANEDHVRLTVRDSGIGIPPEEFQAIFDPFVQVGRRPSGKGERGVGLGLAISRDLADAMGGTLSVRSTVGRGSSFTLCLPRARLSAPVPVSRSGAPVSVSRSGASA